jgi:protein-S-isoprenylcysteine O-methyltransferase Ste14
MNWQRRLGALWFLFLSGTYGLSFYYKLQRPGSLTLEKIPDEITSIGNCVFLLIISWLMLSRREVVVRNRDPLQVVIGLLGTYAIWFSGFLPSAKHLIGPVWLGPILAIVGVSLMLYIIPHLGRSFGVSPQARALVTSGPYRWVRHPLYVAEELVIIELLLRVDWRLAGAILATHIALQYTRTVYEERILTKAFPEYADYAARTARFIPGVW